MVFDGKPVAEYGTEPIDLTILLTNVWREVGRGNRISETAQALGTLLAQRTRIDRLFVRRLDPEKHILETVAFGPGGCEAILAESRTAPSREVVLHLCQRCGERRILRRDGSPEDAALWEAVVPSAVSGETLVVPLSASQGAYAVLGLVMAEGQPAQLEEERLAEELREPFSVAWEHELRHRELEAMRAAVEADRQRLLTKLGRRELTDAVVGADAGLREVMDRVELVARSDVPVLLLGETGTGKEVVARLIHMRSPRASGPFLRVNCGAIPMELIDSHLFGHEKGAFTGAVESRPGWFERADGGTLLLDEMGELPPAAQVRLLRILQDGWLERVGGQGPIHVDVRVVAATHRDLAAMVADGGFRADLWYRIAVFPIRLPPLRERTEDIPALARHFARKAAVRFVLPEVLPTPEDVRLLCGYPWPGNIRELAAVIDRAAILGDGRRLEVAAALGIGAGASAGATAPPRRAALSAESPQLLPLDDVIREHMEAALGACHGRIEGPRGAAAILRVNPHTLRARMRKLKIDWTRFRTADGS